MRAEARHAAVRDAIEAQLSEQASGDRALQKVRSTSMVDVVEESFELLGSADNGRTRMGQSFFWWDGSAPASASGI